MNPLLQRCLTLFCVALPWPAESLAPISLPNKHNNCRHSPQSEFFGVAHHVRQHHHHAVSPFRVLSPRFRLASSLSNDIELDASQQQLLDSLRSMRVKELKSEMESLNVSTRNALEKEELVQRLFNARIDLANGVGTNSVDDDGVQKRKKKKKKRRVYDDDDDDDDAATVEEARAEVEQTVESTDGQSNDYNTNPINSAAPTNESWSITTPFIYYNLETSKSVAAQNAQDIYIRPSPGKYAAIKVQLQKAGQSSPVEFTLLVDTACSGVVLSPSAVARANRQCPGIIQTIDNAGTMTMAGSSQGAAVARWDSYTNMVVGGVEIIGNSNQPNSNVAACQDIGALPSGLDGILGLSFLDQFACVDFDFVNDELRLARLDPNPLIPNLADTVARGQLSLTQLRIYTADVTLDGRGPVKLLVDTGAASTFLNWKGVSAMKLSASSPQIEPLRERIGAMGADNMALELTHRFTLRRRWNLVAENTAVGDFCPGIGLEEDQQNDVDISDLPVLEALKGDGVGGILGADLLMMCDVVRFSGLNGGSLRPSMILMKQ